VSTPARHLSGCLVAALLLLGTAGQGGAQALRITGSTSLRYVELRPIVRDSVVAAETEGSGPLRRTPEGRIVRCTEGDAFCHGTRAGDPFATIPLTQDLEATGWGPWRGLHLFAHLRGRQAWGEPEAWPQADEALAVLAAYLELERERFRLRAGRQWKVSGLGFYNFDGVALALPIAGVATVEGYLGRSLARGLHQPRTGGALTAVEEMAPQEPGLLVGVQGRYRPFPQLAAGFLYHRDIRDDRAGLYAELLAADAVLRLGGAQAETALELDLASGALNEARLRVRSPPFQRMALAAEVRRYRPYFELWTIWGAFSAVGFGEGRAELTWLAPRGELLVRTEGSVRSYHEPGVSSPFGGFRSDAWGAGARVGWTPGARWRAEGGYRVEVGFGGARSEGQAGVVRQLGERGSLALRGSAFQRLYEFRLDEGTVVGLGGDADLRLATRARLFAGLTAYRHLQRSSPEVDWTQLRGHLRMQWTVGAEPAARPPAGGLR
jgi:hypothetical protein